MNGLQKDDVIRLAKETGFFDSEIDDYESLLLCFAKLVAEHEREACAKVCDELAELSRVSETDSMWEWGECAAAIRARGTL